MRDIGVPVDLLRECAFIEGNIDGEQKYEGQNLGLTSSNKLL